MNVPFAIAAALAMTAAAIHGIVGEALVVMKLRTEALWPTRFGGPSMTKLMIRVTWHVATLVFVVVGAAMAACAPSEASRACGGVGRVSAILFGSFALLAMGLVAPQGPRAMLKALRRHPAPLVFVLVACLAWWGSPA